MLKTLDGSAKVDAEGLNNFLDFGYSVLEKTPFVDVKFLKYDSKIILTDGELLVDYKKNGLIEFPEKNSEPTEVIKLIKDYINNYESLVENDIIIPTSGGFDSRLLNITVTNKKRIRSFTYGLSDNQEESYEVVKAKKISQILNTNWQQIELGDFNKFYKQWFFLFGCSTHLHGMYHIEFYSQIKKILKEKNCTLLSGIIGDAWSGKVLIPVINSHKDLTNIGITHNFSCNSKYSKLPKKQEKAMSFTKDNYQSLQDPRFRVITAIRFKIILLSYLMSIPDYFGFLSWTPFLNKNIVLNTLSLPEEEKSNRKWEVDYFKTNNLDLESIDLKYSKQNSLNAFSLKFSIVPALDRNTLSPYMKENVLKKINKVYDRIIEGKITENDLWYRLLKKKFIYGLATRLKINMNFLKPYYCLLTLKAFELSFKLSKEDDKK